MNPPYALNVIQRHKSKSQTLPQRLAPTYSHQQDPSGKGQPKKARNSLIKADFDGGDCLPKGTIKRLISDRGFGFIYTNEGKDLFFHRNELQAGDFRSLREGQQVEFEVGQGRNGCPEALKVRLVQLKTE